VKRIDGIDRIFWDKPRTTGNAKMLGCFAGEATAARRVPRFCRSSPSIPSIRFTEE
jgi:hypothetical protein